MLIPWKKPFSDFCCFAACAQNGKVKSFLSLKMIETTNWAYLRLCTITVHHSYKISFKIDITYIGNRAYLTIWTYLKACLVMFLSQK